MIGSPPLPRTLGELFVEMMALRLRICRHRQEHTAAGMWPTPERLEQQFCYVLQLHELRREIERQAQGLKLVFVEERQCYALIPQCSPVVPGLREKAEG